MSKPSLQRNNFRREFYLGLLLFIEVSNRSNADPGETHHIPSKDSIALLVFRCDNEDTMAARARAGVEPGAKPAFLSLAGNFLGDMRLFHSTAPFKLPMILLADKILWMLWIENSNFTLRKGYFNAVVF